METLSFTVLSMHFQFEEGLYLVLPRAAPACLSYLSRVTGKGCTGSYLCYFSLRCRRVLYIVLADFFWFVQRIDICRASR